MVTRFFFVMATLASIAARAEFNPLDYVMPLPVQWECRRTPYFETNYPVERVRVDLSLDGGATWPIPIAYGYPSQWGTNTLRWSLRVTPDRWTDRARVRIQTLWSSTTNTVAIHQGDISDSNFAIAGIRILAPATNATVYIPSYLPVEWHEAGFEYVRMGTSTDGVHFVEQATLISPPGTNTYLLPLADIPSGPFWIAVGADDVPDLYFKVRVNAVALE